MTLCIVGFDDLVTSFVATIATGWSDPCRVGMSPTEKPRLYTAHTIIRVRSSLTDGSRPRGALPATDIACIVSCHGRAATASISISLDRHSDPLPRAR